jgi:hypothetical protein
MANLKKTKSYLLVAVFMLSVFAAALPQNVGTATVGPDGGNAGDGIPEKTMNAPGNPVTLGPPYDYVIITTNDIVDNSERLENFIYMKELNGHDVLVVTEDD